ncbi:MAG: hypothetical protein Tsb0015_02480 [Simkaniaceae bacterium]
MVFIERWGNWVQEMGNQVVDYVADAIESPQHREMRESAKEILSTVELTSIVALVSSVAFTFFAVLAGGGAGAFLFIAGSLSAITAYDTHQTARKLNKMVEEPRHWICLEFSSEDERYEILKQKFIQASKDTLILKHVAGPLLDVISL